MYSIKFKSNRLWYLDQTKLPLKEVWRECRTLKQGYRAIKELRVRGAPLIGVFAAYCVFVHLKSLPRDKTGFLKQLGRDIKLLKGCRPTAVNLAWSLRRLEETISANEKKSINQIKRSIKLQAGLIHDEDVQQCVRMANFGVKLIKKGDRILTHCNAGFLATSGEGTALALIYEAKKRYRDITVYADETRPLLQGARLTAWEMMKKKVSTFVICDNTAAYLMQKKYIDKIIVGADRIASNGDAANKIGTYNLAVCAFYHKIPFYVVAPSTTFDLTLKEGSLIPIEQRHEDEVRKICGKILITPFKARAYNFAFDVTPAKLITAIVSDRGIIYPPFKQNIKKVLGC